MWRLPLLGIAPSRLRVGSSACTALHSPVTCTSPSSRQPIRGVTLGLGFLRNPSPYALRLAPPPMVSESTYEVTPFPMTMARILRAVLSTGCLWQCRPVRAYGCRRPILCLLAPAYQPLTLGKSDDGSTAPSLALPIDACWTGYPDGGFQAPPFIPASDP